MPDPIGAAQTYIGLVTRRTRRKGGDVFELKRSPPEEERTAGAHMIEARKVRKTYSSGRVKVEVLKGVSL
jgi:hypothetical protein